MNKVIIMNLNGNAYQLEEDAYDALRAYLDTARARLEGNPDRDEIIADIEQAIADKFRAVLGVNKTVVLASEARAAIEAMGPVEDGSGAVPADGAAAAPGAKDPAKAAANEPKGAPKRLYKIHDGAMLAGVCNGLAAYFGIDVSIIRIAFVILTVFYGSGAIVYLVMAIVIPTAITPEQMAAASGTPSTSQDFVKRAREGYYEAMRGFRDKHEYREWRRKVKAEMRGWRQNLKREMQFNAHQWANNWHRHWAQHPPPLFFGGWLLAPFFGLASLVVTLCFLYAFYSVLVHGSAFGIGVPAGMPVWVALLILIFLVQFIVWPLKAARHALSYGCGPYYHPFVHFWNAAFGIAMFVLVIWLFTHHPAQMHEAIRNFAYQVRLAFESIKQWWNSP